MHDRSNAYLSHYYYYLEVLMEVKPLHIVFEMKRKATLIGIEGAGNDCNLTSKDAESLNREYPFANATKG